MTQCIRTNIKSLAAIAVLICFLCFPVYASEASEASNGAQVTVQIPTWNNDTAYVCQLGEGILYIEVESGGTRWPLDTANPFAATVVTVVDAEGSQLGTLESTAGTIDYYDYPEAAKLICSTAFTNDIYEVDLSQFKGTGISQPEFIPEGLGQDRGPSAIDQTLNIAKIITYVVMAIWVIIWITVIVWLLKKKSSRKKDPLSGTWNLQITTPHGINACMLQLSMNEDKLEGILNDALNQNVPLRNGKVTQDGFEGLVNVDIGMNGTPEFQIQARCVEKDKLEGVMILTAMTNIQSTFTGKKEA